MLVPYICGSTIKLLVYVECSYFNFHQLLISEMKRLMSNKQEIHVLKVWSYYITLVGPVSV